MTPPPSDRPRRRVARALFRLVAACAFLPGAHVATAAVPVPATSECVGLVLGGGGARGAAHIGVLRELERQRVPICVVAGTSMGAIVGSLYAAGRSPDEIQSVLDSVDWRDVFRDDPPRPQLPMRRKDAQLNYRLEVEAGWRDGGVQLPYGAVQGQKLGLLLRSLFPEPERDFDRMPIPFRAVAADILSGEPVVPARGDLAAVVRASMSVPAAFAPIELDGRLLVDGGLVNNVPVGVARAMGATRIIAVDVSSPLLERGELRNPADIAFQMVSVLMKERTDRELAGLGPGDLLLRPELGAFSATAFDEATSVVPLGEEAARQAATALAPLAGEAAAYAAWQASLRRPLSARGTVDFVEVDGSLTRTPELVRQRAAALLGRPMSDANVAAAIGSAYAEGTFARIGWTPVARGDRQGVQLRPVDKPWGPVFANVGLQLSDDFAGRSDYQLVAELVSTGLSDDGDEVRALLKLGRVTELSADWFSPFDAGRSAYFAVSGGYQARNVPISIEREQAAEYRLQRTGAGLRLGLQRSPRWDVELGVEHADYRATAVVGGAEFPDARARATAVSVHAGHDTLDSLAFPARGIRTTLDAYRFLPSSSGGADGTLLRWRGDAALGGARHRWILGGRLAGTWGAPPGLATFSTLGGFLNLSGEDEHGLAGTHLAFARAVYYARLGSGGGLLAAPPYLGASLEAGNVWGSRNEMGVDGLIAAGSVFAGIGSPFGPILLGWGRSSRGNSAWSLSFGNLIRSDD